MKVLIIEDEEPAARGLTNLLLSIRPDIEIFGVLQSVEESINWFQSNPSPDLLFLDIQLKDGLSFKIFEEIKVQCPIIFCTAYDQYAIEAFQVNSVDYLLKPIEENELAKSISKFEQLKQTYGVGDEFIKELQEIITSKQKYKERFLVKAGKKLFHVNRQNIAYIYTAQKIVYVVTYNEQKFQLDYNLDQLVELLPNSQFFRVNRQYIVSIQSIESVENDYGSYQLKLNPITEEVVTVSKYRLDDFKKWMNQ